MKIAQSRIGRLLVNHLGFLCDAKKEVIVSGAQDGIFELQDMALNRPAGLGEPENFQAVLTGTFCVVESPLGTYSVGDFSQWTTPGIYRVVLPDTCEHSYHFAITDGAFGWLPEMFLRYIHSRRSGHFENSWRAPTHLDDGIGNNTDQIYAGNSLSQTELEHISFYSSLDASSFRGTGYQIMSGSFLNELGPVPDPQPGSPWPPSSSPEDQWPCAAAVGR